MTATRHPGRSSLPGGVPINKAGLAEWRGHSRDEVARLIVQALDDMGYPESARALVRESGVVVETEPASRFRSAVLTGNWDVVEAMLDSREIPVVVAGADKTIRIAVREQRFLELVEANDVVSALALLQTQITPLGVAASQVQALSSVAMCGSAAELRELVQWDGAAGTSRATLLAMLCRHISPDVIPPDHRLADLFDQNKAGWATRCVCHNTAEPTSLLADHVCGLENMPTEAAVELSDLQTEVWAAVFSPDGTRLAVAGKNRRVLVYETVAFSCVGVLGRNTGGVTHISWSPDSLQLVACCRNMNHDVRLWQVETGICRATLDVFTHPAVSSAWHPDGHSFVTASMDPARSLLVWTSEAIQSAPFSTERGRVFDVSISPDGNRLVSVMADRIHVYSWETRQKLAAWHVDGAVSLTSITFSQNNRDVLVGMNNNGLRLVDVTTGRTVANYLGRKQRSVLVRSSFGGVDENFILSGSEDSHVIVWKRTGQLSMMFEAHADTTINCAHWNPADHYMMATSGDDKKVRIWVPSSRAARLRAIVHEREKLQRESGPGIGNIGHFGVTFDPLS